MSTQYETRPIVDRVVRDVICDRCGGSCRHGSGDVAQFEQARFVAHWGYWSDHDGEYWTADLCQGCAEAVRSFIDRGDGSGVAIELRG